MPITGTLTGEQGASEQVSYPFPGHCAALPFTPKLTAVAGGHGSKADGTSLDVKRRLHGGGAGEHRESRSAAAPGAPVAPIHAAESVHRSRLQRQPCVVRRRLGDRQRDDPHARALRPADGSGVPGLAWWCGVPGCRVRAAGRRHHAARWTARRDIKTGITYSRFESAPDAPFTVFETVLPAGPHSALTANVPEREEYSLCKDEPADADRNHRPERRGDQPDDEHRRERLRRRASRPRPSSSPGRSSLRGP